MLYHNFLNYFDQISSLLEYDFSIWIDGSFISKKENPNDIDLVTIIDFRDYDFNKSIFETRFQPANVRKEFGVDGYIIRKYPKKHPKHFFTHSDSLYWKSLFGKTKVNRAKKQFPKGIIQLNFD